MLRPTYLAALRKINKKDEELQQKFDEVSQKVEKNVSAEKLIFPLGKAIKNYTKSLRIEIINKNDPIIQLNKAIDSVKLLLKKELNEMKGLKNIETLKLTFKKTIADKNETINKIAYFNSKAKTIINKNKIDESIQ